MGLLLVVFAYAIGYATFVENDGGAVAAKIMVYNTTWFEIILLLMIVNFVGMIFTKHLYLRTKLNILVIHLALVIIIIGAGITRYVSFEGQIHIREGQTTNIYRSSDTYLLVELKEGDQVKTIEEKVMIAPGFTNLFSKTYDWQANKLKISVGKFYPNAREVIIKSDTGQPYLTIVVGTSTGRLELGLKDGESKVIGGIGMSFNDTTRNDYVHIINKEDALFGVYQTSLPAMPNWESSDQLIQ